MYYVKVTWIDNNKWIISNEDELSVYNKFVSAVRNLKKDTREIIDIETNCQEYCPGDFQFPVIPWGNKYGRY